MSDALAAARRVIEKAENTPPTDVLVLDTEDMVAVARALLDAMAERDELAAALEKIFYRHPEQSAWTKEEYDMLRPLLASVEAGALARAADMADAHASIEGIAQKIATELRAEAARMSARFGMSSPETLAEREAIYRHALRELARWKTPDGHNCWCFDGGPPHSSACEAAQRAMTMSEFPEVKQPEPELRAALDALQKDGGS